MDCNIILETFFLFCCCSHITLPLNSVSIFYDAIYIGFSLLLVSILMINNELFYNELIYLFVLLFVLLLFQRAKRIKRSFQWID